MLNPYVISFVVLLFLSIVHYSNIPKKRKIVLYVVVTIESLTVLAFFTDPNIGFGKFPILAILPVFIFSSFLLYRSLSSQNSSSAESQYIIYLKSVDTHFLPKVGLLLLVTTIFLEYLIFDSSFSTNSVSLVILGFYLIIYDRVNNLDYDFKIMLMIFIISFCIIYPVSTVLIQLYYNNIGSSSPDFYRKEIVYWSLGRPLSNLLTILGFDVWAIGDTVFYTDLNAGRVSSVSISKGCSGLDSLVVFYCALFSYLYVKHRPFNKITISLFLIGFFISYFANLIRMSIIIIAGHYYGTSALQWAHANIGWLIFTLWVYFFWLLIEKILNYTSFHQYLEEHS